MYTTTNLIIGSLLLCAAGCFSPTSPATSDIGDQDTHPGNFSAAINQQTTRQHDTSTYFLQDIAGSIVSTPQSSQFRLSLPDGTGIILNADTRIAFPQQPGSEKPIILTGEIFLTTAGSLMKIAADAVLIEIPRSTSVNIKAYTQNQSISIAPTQQPIQIEWQAKRFTIPAGQQGIIREGKMTIQKAITEQVAGWRNGLFTQGEPMALLQEMSRWYNVRLQIDGPMPKTILEGALPRTANLKNIITILQANSIPVRLDSVNNSLIVYSTP